MQDETRRLLLESAGAAASSRNVPSVSNLLATLSSQQRPLSAQDILRDPSMLSSLPAPNTSLLGSLPAQKELLRDSSMLGSLPAQNTSLLTSLPAQNASIMSALTNRLPRPSVANVARYPDTTEVDSLILARTIAARRQLELKQALAQQQDALMNEAYKRGREEALLSLLSFDGGENAQLSRKPVAAKSFPGRQDGNRDQETLAALGSSGIANRDQKSSYFDASLLEDPDPVDLANRRARGGVTEPFPEKLHRMLSEAEKDRTIKKSIGFLPHGRAFVIHNPITFVADIMPKFFRQSRMSSFQRQLNLYGFTRITSGPDVGGYYHELFLKGRPNLAVHMRRVGATNSTKRKQSKPDSRDPNFYAMQPIGKTDISKKR